MRRAFTIIELMLSIMLLGLIITFLAHALGEIRISNDVLKQSRDRIERATKRVALMQADILQSVEVNTTQIIPAKGYVLLALRTKSSIYQIDRPYVRWFVDPKTKRMLRSESAYNLNPPYYDEDLYRVHIDEVANSCEWFKVYPSQEHDALLVGMQCDGTAAPMLFEARQF